MKLTQAFITYLATLLIGSSIGAANPILQEPNDGFYSATKIDDMETTSTIASMLNVFQLFTQEKIVSFGDNPKVELLDFFYASGPNYIRNQRVSETALPILDEAGKNKLMNLATNTDVCYIQGIVLDSGQAILIVIHNEDNDFAEDKYRCLVAGLWKYHFGDLNGFEGVDWRSEFVSILTGGK